MNKRMWWSWVVLVAVSVALVGCGGDDDGGNQPAAGAGGAIAGVGGAGVGGAGGAGAGGSSGTGGAGGSAAVSVPCGTATCMGISLPIPLPLPQPCCVDSTMGTCGTMPAAGGACMPPMPNDERCPAVTVPLFPVTTCCADNGMCGLDASALGMGCVDFDTIRSGMAGSFLPVPAAVVCDGDGGIDADGGE